MNGASDPGPNLSRSPASTAVVSQQLSRTRVQSPVLQCKPRPPTFSLVTVPTSCITIDPPSKRAHVAPPPIGN
ncbi:hypothetical protein GN956_G20489 [Arapaima gigas]